jgi:hypothetical protein
VIILLFAFPTVVEPTTNRRSWQPEQRESAEMTADAAEDSFASLREAAVKAFSRDACAAGTCGTPCLLTSGLLSFFRRARRSGTASSSMVFLPISMDA